MPTLGAQIVPARINELHRALIDLSAGDMAQLEPELGNWLKRPLGRELLAARLLVSDSVYVCLYNLEPAGIIVLRRGNVAAQIRALAISPDLRRNGLARSLLDETTIKARERGLGWIWMTVPSTNAAATKCALACGFRRYRPQFLRRRLASTLPARAAGVRLHSVEGSEAANLIVDWMRVEVTAGDTWVQGLVESELMPLLLPIRGLVWQCVIDETNAGCAHLGGTRQHPVVTLWLDSVYWNTPAEIACLKSVLDTMVVVPDSIDLCLGSEGHLRASVVQFKALHMQPVLFERVFMVKPVVPVANKSDAVVKT